MSEITLPCQGLPCPQPVLECKKTLTASRPDSLRVQVDNEAAKENVTRFLRTQGYEVLSIQEHEGSYELLAAPQGRESGQGGETQPDEPATVSNADTGSAQTTAQLVLITSNVIGHGDDALGEKLMHNFLATLPEMGSSLWRILLLNSGVKLAVEGSPVLETLQSLEQSGVSILVCGTCLGFFDLLEYKKVGETTNMLDVVTSLQLAEKVITL